MWMHVHVMAILLNIDSRKIVDNWIYQENMVIIQNHQLDSKIGAL